MTKIVATLSLGLLSISPMMGQVQDTVSLDEAVVTGTRIIANSRDLPVSLTTVSRNKLTENFRPSILPTLSEQVPGLFVTNKGVLGYGVSTGSAGTMKIRGIGGMAQTLVLIDGLPQYAGLYGHPIPDAYLTMMADRVEVLRGPASLFYGSNAMGGVMNIVTRKLATDGINNNVELGWGSYGTLQSEFNSIFRSGNFNGSAGINYNRTDGDRKDSQFEEGSGFLKLGYDFNSHWSIDAMGNLNWFKSSNPGPITAPLLDNDQRVLRGVASLSLTNKYEKASGALRGFYSWGHHHINDGYLATATPRTSLYLHDDLMLGVSAYEAFNLFKGNTTTVGADWQHFGGHAYNRVIATGVESDIIDKTEDEFAGYVDFRQGLTGWFALDAGLRVDHHTQVGTELVPQGGLIFSLPQQAEIKAMVSKGFHNPTIKDLYMYGIANDQLEPERMMNYELSYKQRFMDNRLRTGANIFYIDADNIINTEMVNGRRQNVNSGELKNWGFELEAGYRLSHDLEINANYSFLHMKNHIIAAPENKLYVGADYVPGRFSFHTGLQYISGLYTQTGTNEKKEEFLLWNLTAAYQIHTNFCIFARGENLLAQKYEINAGFPMPRATFMGGVRITF